MSRTEFRFEHAWWLPVPRSAVFDVLADVGRYPRWWPQVRAVARVDDATARVVVRSVLPYSLDLVLVRAVEDRDAGVLQAAIHGRLDGWSRWTLSGQGPATWLRYEQQVTVQGAAMWVASTVARPVLVANHEAMMHGGRRGLLDLLRGQPCSSAGR